MHCAQIIARTIAPPLGQQRIDPLDVARSLIVLGCAAALILAGPIFPA